ncbi:hypothetical protein NDA07_21620 [Microcoleus vaginatus DQ-U2]|uniref:hypothetical protein n=1 Tax=Microcoleus vaginatus TaxID=119532 RepID=UPI0016872269|nr:hypothetical protein [Microcoleus sp. FACHB-DQ6]
MVHLMWNSPESRFGRDTPQENSLFVEQAGKPVANPQENSLFVEQAGKPVADGRAGHPTIKFTQDVDSKVRSLF